MIPRLTADELRQSFLGFFAENGHTPLPSASLIPQHPAAPMFTNAGMNQFLPYFLAEEMPPIKRATTSQKCVRVRGKHDDIEIIGRTTRHLTFFEMLGNFSFGDYFKQGAMQFAWTFLTERLGMEPGRLWVTVYQDDDEAVKLWTESLGVPVDRIRRCGADNFWEMGPTGPCGPCSEIFYDKGPAFGEGGGPEVGSDERFVEIWNLVFMQFNRQADGSLVPLKAQNIDTGAGLERILPICQGTSSVFDTDVLRGLITTAEELTGRTYGKNSEDDVSLRIMADHARTITFLIGDGVVPSNEGRGYVLRRILRRAARHAQRLGRTQPALPAMAAAVARAMHAGYPEVGQNLGRIQATLDREEKAFTTNLTIGLGKLKGLFDGGTTAVPGPMAFELHDTFGFPIDLTREIAAERGATVDVEGFEKAMADQRERARAAAGKETVVPGRDQDLRQQVGGDGPIKFVGFSDLTATSVVRTVLPDQKEPGRVDVYTDATPFYAEKGGQVGDAGTVVGPNGRGTVLDTTPPAEGLIRHSVKIDQGTIAAGDTVTLAVDAARRAAIRRNHTAVHLLQWALRQEFGQQVGQQGSRVTADALRFDFNHHQLPTDDQLRDIEDRVNRQVLANTPVVTQELNQAEAKKTGALSFFGDKYGDVVRVVTAGDSVEFCGGTHAAATGDIGQFLITNVFSVGSNLNRIEAVTGLNAIERNRQRMNTLKAAAKSLKAAPDDVPAAVQRLLDGQKVLQQDLSRLQQLQDNALGNDLVKQAVNGTVVARVDGRDQPAMRTLASGLLKQDGVEAVGLVGVAGATVTVVVALREGRGDASALARDAGKLVGGGGGGRDKQLAAAGGKNADAVPQALAFLKQQLSGQPA